jgi:hypothetical protein
MFTFERTTTIMELLLFVWIVVQGEKIIYYEKGVHKIQSKREKERADWREAKRKQVIKKSDAAIADKEPKA